MVDKFTRLTFRMLKELNPKYTHRLVKVLLNKEYDISYGHVERYGYVNIFSFNNSGIYSDAKLHISEVYAHKGFVRISYTLMARDYIDDGNDIVKLYIDIISKIFDKHLIYLKYRVLNINDSAEYIVDELLNYTDEEFKLYLSLL